MSLPEEITADTAEGLGPSPGIHNAFLVGSLSHRHEHGSKDELTPLGKTSGSAMQLSPCSLPQVFPGIAASGSHYTQLIPY